MEKKENEIFKSQNLVKFTKMYIGGASGISKKGNEYCMVKFLEINRYGNGDVITLSVDGNKLPDICSTLVCGDIVEVLVDIRNMVDAPVLIDIERKVSSSLIYQKQ